MRGEGFFEIVNRDSPELITGSRDIGTVKANTHYESATRTCCGCQRVVVLRPDRTRERHYCRTCDSYMCDDCAITFKVTGSHTPFNKIYDQAFELAARGHDPKELIYANRIGQEIPR